MEDQAKLRIIYLYNILSKYTNEKHQLTTNQINEKLIELYNAPVNRNTLTHDLLLMKAAGIGIEAYRGTQNRYYYSGHPFAPGELKILIDAVASSRFIPEKRSKDLIKKLSKLTNEHDAEKLFTNVIPDARVKSESDIGYDMVETVNNAISNREHISFQYTDYDVRGKRILRQNGEQYIVSPYALVWDGDYYYLIGWSENRGEVRNYRLDRIKETPILLGTEGFVEQPEDFNLKEYRKTVFRMFGNGEPVAVTLQGEAHTMKGLIDNFGSRCGAKAIDKNHYQATVKVVPSPTFFRWVFGWNGAMKIVGPEEVREEYREMVRRALEE